MEVEPKLGDKLPKFQRTKISYRKHPCWLLLISDLSMDVVCFSAPRMVARLESKEPAGGDGTRKERFIL